MDTIRIGHASIAASLRLELKWRISSLRLRRSFSQTALDCPCLPQPGAIAALLVGGHRAVAHGDVAGNFEGFGLASVVGEKLCRADKWLGAGGAPGDLVENSHRFVGAAKPGQDLSKQTGGPPETVFRIGGRYAAEVG